MDNMQKKIVLLEVLLIIANGALLYLFITLLTEDEPREITPKKVELSEIKIGVIEGDPLLLPLFIAAEEGFFEKEGLRVKFEPLSISDNVGALLTGEIDYACFFVSFGGPYLQTSLENAPIKTIMFLSRYFVNSVSARPKLELSSLKSIGIASQPPFLNKLLRYQVLKFTEEKKIEVKIISAKYNELQTFLPLGMADAVLVPDGVALENQIRGFPILYTRMDILPSGLTVRNDKIENEPKEVQKVISAIRQATEFIATEPEKIKEHLFREYEIEKTEENLQIAEERGYPFIKAVYDRRNVPPDEGAELLIKIIKAGDFTTLREVEEQVVTAEEFQKVFDFRFAK